MLEVIKDGFSFTDTPEFEFEQEQSEGTETDSFIIEVCKKTETDVHKADDLDFLTGFPIRKSFELSVNTYLDNPLNRGTMFLMDVDNFLHVNKNYGHIAGDHIICRLADIIRSNIETSAYMCRISGDEFAVFYQEERTEEWIRDVAQTILTDFQEAVSEIDTDHILSVSIGISYTKNPLERCRDLLQQCDKALYYVKNNGKNSYQILQRDSDAFTESQNQGFQIDIAHLKSRDGRNAGVWRVFCGLR